MGVLAHAQSRSAVLRSGRLNSRHNHRSHRRTSRGGQIFRNRHNSDGAARNRRRRSLHSPHIHPRALLALAVFRGSDVLLGIALFRRWLGHSLFRRSRGHNLGWRRQRGGGACCGGRRFGDWPRPRQWRYSPALERLEARDLPGWSRRFLRVPPAREQPVPRLAALRRSGFTLAGFGAAGPCWLWDRLWHSR